MTTEHTEAHEGPTGPASRESIQKLWYLLLEHFIRYMENTPAPKIRASMMDVIRAFLRDNEVSIDRLQSPEDVRQALQTMKALVLPFTGGSDKR